MRVSSSAPGVAYRVEAIDAPWLAFDQREGAIPSDGRAFEADTVRVRIDASRLLSGDHNGRVRFSTWRGANAPELTLALRVAPATSALPDPTPTPMTIAAPAIAFVEIAAPVHISPPDVTPPAAPKFPKAPPKRIVRPGGGAIRSRVLPIPKVVLPPAKPATKEPPPERTKPSAMPPAAPEKKAAH